MSFQYLALVLNRILSLISGSWRLFCSYSRRRCAFSSGVSVGLFIFLLFRCFGVFLGLVAFGLGVDLALLALPHPGGSVKLSTKICLLEGSIPSNPFQIPLQMGDVNWYPGAENVAPENTALSTARQTLTAHELVAEVPWSYDLDEDAVIAMMEELRRGLLRNAREVIDDVILNGDTSTVDNINADGATISSDDAGKGHWLVGFDGLLHLPLIDNSKQAIDHGAGVSDDMFNEVRARLRKYGVRPSEAVYVTDVNTFIRSLGVSNFRTLDKFGPQATLLTGQLGAVEGIPVIVSEQMALADADGKVTDGGNVASTGRLLIVNRSQWRLGFKRELTIETVRDAQKRQNIMVVSFRIALQERSGNRSTATHTALQYNITGV